MKHFLKYSLLNGKKINGRLPCCLPIKTNLSENKLKEIGFSTGKRNFLIDSKLQKVFPLPIHQDLSISFLKKIIPLFSKSNIDLKI